MHVNALSQDPSYEDSIAGPSLRSVVLVQRCGVRANYRLVVAAGAYQNRDAADTRRGAKAGDRAERYPPHHGYREQGHSSLHRFSPHHVARNGPLLEDGDAGAAAAIGRTVQTAPDPHLFGRYRSAPRGSTDRLPTVAHLSRRYGRGGAHGRAHGRPAIADR